MPFPRRSLFLVDVSFALLAPDLMPEMVHLQVLSPQPTDEVLDLLDTCRGRVNADLYPRLHLVHPLPSDRHVHVLMSPAWAIERVLVCLDLTQCEGAIFAAASSPLVDSYTLLNMAGFSSSSLSDIYVPGSPVPLAPGEEVHLTTGDCVCFVPQGEPLRRLSALRDALSSPTAAPTDHVALDATEPDRFCLVADGAYFAFCLYPERSFWYRQDVASRLQIVPQSLLFSPTQPRVTNAQVYGRSCRSVIAVGECTPYSPAGAAAVGLLDCRPILEGWRRLVAPEGWVDLAALRAGLMQGAPVGFRISFDGFPFHWNWTWLSNGQVIRAVYRPIPGGSSSGVPSDPASDGSLVPLSPPQRFPESRLAQPGEDVDSRRSDGISERRHEHGSTTGHSACADGMWTSGLRLHTCHPGILRLTSAMLLLCTGACAVASVAVCFTRRYCHRVFAAVTWFLLLEHFEAMGVDAMQLRGVPGGTLSDPPFVGRSAPLEPCAPLAVEPVLHRPLPTPCRAVPSVCDGLLAAASHLAPPASDLHNWACDGPTLLEESVWGAASEAFFNASTLLEVLDEHFHANSCPVICTPETVRLDGPHEPATCLALDMLIPDAKTAASGAAAAVEVFDLDAGQCSIPVSDELWWDLCQFVSASALPRDASGLLKPWRFSDWVSSGITHISPDAAFLCVTADGSFDPASGAAGWGVVFSLIDATGSLPGLHLGHFCGRTADVWSLGADDNAPVNAFASELVGLVWAAVACFQLRIQLPLIFRCDNQAALGIAAGCAVGQTHAICRACQGLALRPSLFMCICPLVPARARPFW